MKNLLITVLLLIAFILVLSCEKPKSIEDQQWDKIKDTKLSDLQKDNVKHQLTQDQIIRSNNVQKILSEIDPSTPEQWIDDFTRDDDPESELLIWEEIAKIYENYINKNTVDIETKKEIESVLLFRAAISADQVIESIDKLKLNRLSIDQAKTIMNDYKLKPKPIVIRVSN